MLVRIDPEKNGPDEHDEKLSGKQLTEKGTEEYRYRLISKNSRIIRKTA